MPDPSVTYPGFVSNANWGVLTLPQQVAALQWFYIGLLMKKMLCLHDGLFKWTHQDSPDFVPLTPTEEDAVASIFHAGNLWGVVYPTDTPTKEQATAWFKAYWMDANEAARSERKRLKSLLPEEWLASIDLKAALYS